jgi:hypothetical protein
MIYVQHHDVCFFFFWKTAVPNSLRQQEKKEQLPNPPIDIPSMIHESTMGDVPGTRNMHTPGSKEAHCSAAFVQILKPRDEWYKKKFSGHTWGGGADNAIKVFRPLAAFSFYENLFFSIWSDSFFFPRSLATLLGLAGLQRSSCKLCVWSTSSLMRIDLHNPNREVSFYLSIYLQEAATTGRGWLLGGSPCASWQPRLPFASPERRKSPTAAREGWVGLASGAANPENYKGFSSWYSKFLHRTLWQLPVVSRKYPTISFASAMWVGSPSPTCSVPAGVSRLWKAPSSLLRLLLLLLLLLHLQCNN